jgi:hypothetical protein
MYFAGIEVILRSNCEPSLVDIIATATATCTLFCSVELRSINSEPEGGALCAMHRMRCSSRQQRFSASSMLAIEEHPIPHASRRSIPPAKPTNHVTDGTRAAADRE